MPPDCRVRLEAPGALTGFLRVRPIAVIMKPLSSEILFVSLFGEINRTMNLQQVEPPTDLFVTFYSLHSANSSTTKSGLGLWGDAKSSRYSVAICFKIIESE